MIGKLARMVESKGFCFVAISGKPDHFLHKEEFRGHWDDLVKDFTTGEEIYIEFDSVTSAKGLRAENAARTDWPSASAREVTRERNGI